MAGSFREEDVERYAPVPVTMELQLIAKLASLESAVSQGFRRLDDKMDRFQSDLHDANMTSNDRINQLDKETTERFALKRARIDDVEKRIVELETWTKVAMAKVSVMMTVIALIWIVLAPSIRQILGVPPG